MFSLDIKISKLDLSLCIKRQRLLVRSVCCGMLLLIACPISTAFAATSSSIADGQTVYNTICSTCHGPNAADNVHNIKNGASNPSLIQSLINVNFGGMGVLQTQYHLSSTQIDDAADYLGSVFYPNQGAPGIASNPPSI